MSLKSTSGRDFLAPAPVPKLTRTPAAAAAGAPRLGEHTQTVRDDVERIAGRRRPDVKRDDQVGAGPLAGVRVLDLSQWLAGPAAAALLGDFGAEVIMIELPATGPAASDGPGSRGPGFPVTNRNKKSVTLDVRSPSGREVFLALARASDVIVENFRPGTLERWNLGPEVLRQINPRLVLLRSSGFGQSGPFTARAAFNPVGLAFGGMTYLNGWPDRPPVRDGVTAGDYSTALFNVLGIVAALLRRDLDGEGQVVDTAMYECALRLTGDTLAVRSALGIRRERAGGAWPVYPSSLTVAAADGRSVAVSSGSWDDFAHALERLGRPRVAEPARVTRRGGEAREPARGRRGRPGVAPRRPRRERRELGRRPGPRAPPLEPRRSRPVRRSGSGRDRHAGDRPPVLADAGPDQRLAGAPGLGQRRRARRAYFGTSPLNRGMTSFASSSIEWRHALGFSE